MLGGLTGDFQNFSLDVGDGYTSVAQSTPERWLAGTTVEARLPFHLSVEVDGLFHELEFTKGFHGPQFLGNGQAPGPVITAYRPPMHVVTWEFPVLLKYHLPMRLVPTTVPNQIEFDGDYFSLALLGIPTLTSLCENSGADRSRWSRFHSNTPTLTHGVSGRREGWAVDA